MKTLLTLLFLTSSLFSQTVINVGNITMPDEVATAVNTWRKAHSASYAGKLTSGINGATTTIPVDTVVGISVGSHLMIEEEELTVTAVNGGSVTATRGTVGTANVPHASGIQVRVLEWATPVALVKQFIKGGIVSILRSIPSSTIATAQTAIATQQAAIDAAEAAAVQ